MSLANSSISETTIVTKKMNNVYVINVEFKVTADIAAYSGVFKVTDDIKTTSLIVPIPAVCWDDGSTAWFYQQYNNIMNRTKLLKGKYYEFSYVYIV